MKHIVICVGSVYGAALETAKAIRTALQEEGYTAELHDAPTLDSVTQTEGAILVCTSTTGTGDLPDNIAPLYIGLTNDFPNIVGRPFGVITLGDSSYFDTYGGAGDLIFEAFTELAAKPLTPLLKIDAQETADPEEVAVPWAKEWARQLDSF
ncbi:flavodoxin domain-containing protein [Hahella ganghwensis]|uniref:flavodoxin domain-containing protein n=1 Tax=Hahella ganghwensis TaxID=286420 RepID=UPI000381A9D8|nr:flavodoxin domain-containing protein [Hahella ganghwensis]